MVPGFDLDGRDVCDRLEVLAAVEAFDLFIAATEQSRPRNSCLQQTAEGERAELERIEAEPWASASGHLGSEVLDHALRQRIVVRVADAAGRLLNLRFGEAPSIIAQDVLLGLSRSSQYHLLRLVSYLHNALFYYFPLVNLRIITAMTKEIPVCG